MVIESLKQSKAVMTKPQQLMKRLPDGMNNLYKQKLQGLQEFDREILLIALRWLMCSEGQIETELVADDIEHCFEDLDPYEADLAPEDSEDSDTDTVVATVVEISPGMEAQERVAEYDRDSIKRLKEVGRDFVKFSSAVVDVQHQSVRDFINSEEMSQPRDPRICSECAKRMNHESAYQASPKNGHLIMVERIFEKLMSASFRDKFIIIGSFDQTKADAGLVFSPPKGQDFDMILTLVSAIVLITIRLATTRQDTSLLNGQDTYELQRKHGLKLNAILICKTAGTSFTTA